MARRKILVIDDDHATLQMMDDLLCDEYDVSIAEDIAQAGECLKQQRFDLLILDVRMPLTDGLAYLNQLALDPKLAALPVLVASADGDALARFQPEPHRKYLAKPVRSTVLFAAISELLASEESV